MLPRAIALDARPRALGRFVAGHCALAGALQLAALVADLARAGRPLPSAPSVIWAWLGLAVIAAVPALVTVVVEMAARPRPPRARIARVLAIGLGFYCVPVLLLIGSLGPVLTFVPVAVLFHGVLAYAPVR